MKRRCVCCRRTKQIAFFREGQGGGWRNQCRKCENRIGNERRRRRWAADPALKKKRNEHLAAMRRSGFDVARWILDDARCSDRKKGLTCNLTKAWIQTTITKGCCYCGNSEIRMTLDRIDNAIGHVTANVVPACIRCNYIRRHMPYAAWLKLAPAIRRAFRQGLFGDWTGSPHKRH
jgi:hypothetical protein